MRLLTGKIFTMGGQYTVCDAYLLVFCCWGCRAGWDMKTQFPNWTRQALRIASRPTVKPGVRGERHQARFAGQGQRQSANFCARADLLRGNSTQK